MLGHLTSALLLSKWIIHIINFMNSRKIEKHKFSIKILV